MGKNRQPKETWAGAVRAIGVRALSTGKFMQFVFLCVMVAAIWTTDSVDKVKIVDTLAQSGWLQLFGWLLALTFALGSVIVLSVIRKAHLGEIARLSQERDQLQEKLLKTVVQHSEYKPK